MNRQKASPLSLDITAMILTYNEEDNISRALESVKWAREILIVDSGSSDSTLDIVRRYPNARVVERRFDSFAGQCNFGLSHVSTPWVLSMDADYELSPELVSEVQKLVPESDVYGYRMRFVYRIFGKPLRGSLYPPRICLYRPSRARYQDEGHGHRVVVGGKVRDMVACMWHDDRKPLARWFVSQKSYSRRELDFLLSTPKSQLRKVDRIRLMAWPAPILVIPYTLFVKGCIFDGRAGWFYALQRMLAETLMALEILARRLSVK